MERRGWRPSNGSEMVFAVIQAGADDDLKQGSCSGNREKCVDLRAIKEADMTMLGDWLTRRGKDREAAGALPRFLTR